MIFGDSPQGAPLKSSENQTQCVLYPSSTSENTSSEHGICEGAMKTEERNKLAIAEEEGKSGGENAEERREERGERRKLLLEL